MWVYGVCVRGGEVWKGIEGVRGEGMLHTLNPAMSDGFTTDSYI